MFQRHIASTLTLLLVWMAGAGAYAEVARTVELRQLVEKPYLELLEHATTARFSAQEIEQFRKQLEKEKDAEKERLKTQEKELKQRVDIARKELEKLNKQSSRDTDVMASKRQDLHCGVQKMELELTKIKTARDQGVPVAYENKFAKLDLLGEWPAKKKEIETNIASEHARDRRWGNVEDIGVRVIAEGQEKDIKVGERAVQEMKAYGMMPPEVEDKEIKGYVEKLAQTVASNSDLKVPVKVTVLDSDEVNAFALPGGFLYVNTGVLSKAETESEVVGVIAHELGHVTARHGAKLMKRATIANYIFQGAQLAAAIFTGGLSSVAAYYALQYGFYGLGMMLDLTLLGVSRDYEMEADQLGVQYAWKAGYAPLGFTTFFDKMASEKGYVRSASFFRTHPPFFNRIVGTFSEISYLPAAKTDLKVDSADFHRVKEQLTKVENETKQERKNRPTLRRGPQCPDDEMEKISKSTD